MTSKSVNVILFADMPSANWFARGYGAYRIASEIRKLGFTVLTVDFSSMIDWPTFQKIIDSSVGDETIMVGFSTTWYPTKHKKMPNPRYFVGMNSLSVDPSVDFDPNIHPWYFDSMAYSISGGELEKYVRYIKKINSKIKITIGGAKSHEYITEQCVDHIFVGYSENHIIDFLTSKRIFNKIINYDVKAQSGSFDFNKSKTIYVDTDCILPSETLTFEFSRGCIFNCAFCSYPHRNQDTRNYVKYQETIRDELLDNWKKWGAYKYVITDDTFNDYTEKLMLIEEVIKDLPFKPEFWAYTRQDLIASHPEQAVLMKNIGVTETYYGLETWCDETAKAIRKGGSKSRKIDGMRICKEVWGNEVYTVAGIVIGLPHDTVTSINDSVTWYRNEGHKYIDLFGYGSLVLRDYGDRLQYISTSDIEKNLGQWGYNIPDPTNKPHHWVRIGGDINSKEQADQLMLSSNAACKPYWNSVNVWNWVDIFISNNLDLNRNRTDIVYDHVTKFYIPKLLGILENKSW
jgi:hypothetical protein